MHDSGPLQQSGIELIVERTAFVEFSGQFVQRIGIAFRDPDPPVLAPSASGGGALNELIPFGRRFTIANRNKLARSNRSSAFTEQNTQTPPKFRNKPVGVYRFHQTLDLGLRQTMAKLNWRRRT